MRKRLGFFVAILVPVFVAVTRSPAGDSTWLYSVQVTAMVQASPTKITLSWLRDEPSVRRYTVSRKSLDAASWGPAISLPGTATTFTDTDVSVGSCYEYQIVKEGAANDGYGYICTGIERPLVEKRGTVVLVVDRTYAGALATELDRLQQDLIGDGWKVARKEVGSQDSPVYVRSLIQTEYAADRWQVKAVFLFGHVPILRSGNLNVDGHLARPMPADAFYGDMDGVWTDLNGDGIYDQSELPSDVELQVGRVDFFNLPGAYGTVPFPSEVELLRQYLKKDHDFRTARVRPAQRALVGNRFGDFAGEAFAASGYRNFAPLVGPQNISSAESEDPTPDAERWISKLAQTDYLWAFGCGGGSQVSVSGLGTHGQFHDVWAADFVNQNAKATFYLMFGSWLGEWDQPDNLMRATLATKDYGLTCSWSGRPHHYYHAMAMGETIGQGIRLSQNNRGLYRNELNNVQHGVHIALMGDPTLRMTIVAPPTALSAENGNLAWSPSPDAVLGYHVYRSIHADGHFTRLTTSPLTDTRFTDPNPVSDATYMVRAVKLETTPSGSYYNASEGAFAE